MKTPEFTTMNRRGFLIGSSLALCPIAAHSASNPISTMIASLTDQMRQNKGQNALRNSNRLNHAAEVFSQILAQSQELSHTADGRDLSYRANSVGYSFERLGENIGWTAGPSTPDSIAVDLVERWMASRGHRVNILNRRFRDIGVGVTQTGGRTYAVQIFGTQA